MVVRSHESGGVRWRLLVAVILLLVGVWIWRRAAVSATDDGWVTLGGLPDEVWGGAAVANPRFVVEFGKTLTEGWGGEVEFWLRDDLLEATGWDVLSVGAWRRAGFDPEAPAWLAAPMLDASGDSLAVVVSIGVLDSEQALATLHRIAEWAEFEWLPVREGGHDIYTEEHEMAFLIRGQRLYFSGADSQEDAVAGLRHLVDGTAARLTDNADFRLVRGGLPQSNFAAYLPLSRLVRVLHHEDFRLSPEERLWLAWFEANFRASGLVADRGYGRLLLTFAEDSKLDDWLRPAGSSRAFTGRFDEPIFAFNVSLERPIPLLAGLIEQLGGAEALAELEEELEEELQTDREQLAAIFGQLTGGLLFYGFTGFFEPEFVIFMAVDGDSRATVEEWIRRLSPEFRPRRYGDNVLYQEPRGGFRVGFVDGYLVFGNETRRIVNVAEGRYADWQPRGGDALLSLELRIARVMAEAGTMMPPEIVDLITLLFGRERDRQYIHAELTRSRRGLVLEAETPALRVLFGGRPW